MKMRVPKAVILGFCDLKEPNAACDRTTQKFEVPKFPKALVKVVDLIGKR
jgi:hypothetical protein